jgi:hypothetical protein
MNGAGQEAAWQSWMWAEKAYRDEWGKYWAGSWVVGEGFPPSTPKKLTAEARRELNRLRDEARAAQAAHEDALKD